MSQDSIPATPDSSTAPATETPATTSPLFTREEIARIKANRTAVAEHFAARRDRAEAWVSLLEWLEDDVITPLTARWKAPFQPGWEKSSSTDWDGLRAALAETEINAGLVLGPSRRVAFDADNLAGTEALLAAGHHIHHVSPGSRHPDHDHAGGCTALHRLPSWVPDVRLTGPTTAVQLANGGKIDVLAGNHQVVLPLSVVQYEELDGFSGRYMTASEAGLVPEERDGWEIEAGGEDLILPLWALSEELLAYAPEGAVTPEAMTVPAGLEALAGTISVWKEEERTYDPGDRDELTEKIDGLDLLSLIEEAGVEGQRRGLWSGEHSGCELWLRKGSSAGYSLVVHNGCHMGYVVMVFTTGIPTLPAGGHSRLDAYIGLTERSKSDRGSVMAKLGLIKPRVFGGLVDGMWDMAERYEHAAETEDFSAVAEMVTTADGTIRPDAAVYCLEKARLERERARIIQAAFGGPVATGQPVETHTTGMAWGAPVPPIPQPQNPVPPQMQAAPTPGEQQDPLDAETVELPDEAPTHMAPAVDDAIDGELVGETDKAAAARKIFRELRPAIKEIERQMAELTPGLKRCANFAESRGIYMHGFVGGILPPLLSDVPPNVMYPPLSNIRTSKSEGQGINAFGIPIGPSSSGKTVTAGAAKAAIPLKEGVVVTRNGTSESWSKKLRGRTKDGEDFIRATSLLIDIDEVNKFNVELERIGSKTAGWIAETWQGTGGGQDTSEEKNAAVLPDHGSRVGIRVNAQPGLMGTLLDLAEQGAGHRFYKCLVGLVPKEELGDLFGIAVPAVMADQSRQPWYSALPVGYPPARCQQPTEAAAAAVAAAGPVPPPQIHGVGEKEAKQLGVPGYDNEAPIWIELPETAKADMEAGLQVARDRGADWGTAMDQDAEGLVTGHRVTMQKNIAFCFAVLDGEHNPNDAHWEAAGLFLTGSDLVMQACIAYLELRGEADAFRAGHLKGVGFAASRAAETTVTNRGTRSSMAAIIKRLQICGGSAFPGHLKAGSDGKKGLPKFGSMSQSQRDHAEQAAEILYKAGNLRFEMDGRWTLIGQLAVAA